MFLSNLSIKRPVFATVLMLALVTIGLFSYRRLAIEIQEMLQLAILQSADEQPKPVRLDLAEMMRWAIARTGATAQERRVTVDEDLAPAPIVAVEDHIKMLLTNIIANAVVYSNEGGSVQVRCSLAPPDGPVVTIEDEGIGIPAEKLPRIFDDYYRTEEAVRHNKDSTGLGLAIVRSRRSVCVIRSMQATPWSVWCWQRTLASKSLMGSQACTPLLTSICCNIACANRSSRSWISAPPD